MCKLPTFAAFSFLVDVLNTMSIERHTELYPMQELIWTKVAYVLGDTYPSLAELSPAEELTIQKLFFDYLCHR